MLLDAARLKLKPHAGRAQQHAWGAEPQTRFHGSVSYWMPTYGTEQRKRLERFFITELLTWTQRDQRSYVVGHLFAPLGAAVFTVMLALYSPRNLLSAMVGGFSLWVWTICLKVFVVESEWRWCSSNAWRQRQELFGRSPAWDGISLLFNCIV